MTEDNIKVFLEGIQSRLQRIVEDYVPQAKLEKKAELFQNPNYIRVIEAAKRSRKKYKRTRNTNNREDLRVAKREKIATFKKERTFYFLEAIDRQSANLKGLQAIAKYGKKKSIKSKDLPKFPILKIDINIKAKTFE